MTHMKRTAALCTVCALLLCLAAPALAQEAAVKVTPFVPFVADVYTGNVTEDGPKALTEKNFADAELTLVNIWATWCGPCISEIPYLGELAARSGGRVQVWGVLSDALDMQGNEDADALDAAVTLMKSGRAAYPIVVPDAMLSKIVAMCTAVPTTFIVDAKGNVAGVQVGSDDLDGWVALCQQYLPDFELTDVIPDAAP